MATLFMFLGPLHLWVLYRLTNAWSFIQFSLIFKMLGNFPNVSAALQNYTSMLGFSPAEAGSFKMLMCGSHR